MTDIFKEIVVHGCCNKILRRIYNTTYISTHVRLKKRTNCPN